jgi:hypothetical protein
MRESPGGIMVWHRSGLPLKLLREKILWLGGKETPTVSWMVEIGNRQVSLYHV